MKPASELVFEAFRELNVIALGASLTPAQTAEGLTLMNRFISGLFNYELGEFDIDWPVAPMPSAPVNARFPLLPQKQQLNSSQWPYPPANVRILIGLTANTTIYLPQRPSDGATMLFLDILGSDTYTLTVDGNGRLVQGAATSSQLPSVWSGTRLLYRADQGNWTPVTTLTDTDVIPLPELYEDLVTIGTAKRLAQRYGKSLQAETLDTYNTLRKRLLAQYKQDRPSPSASPQPFWAPASSSNTGFYPGDEGELY